jgi:hypothetical protein
MHQPAAAFAVSPATPLALALAALAHAPLPSAAARCVANATPPARADVFGAVRRLALGRYLERTPSAVRAIGLLAGRGCALHNDHIALRAFAIDEAASGLAFLERLFLPFGYARRDALTIPGMPLNARWYEPPEASGWPKVFVSELRVGELPAPAAAIVRRVVGAYYAPDGPATSAADAAVAAGDAAALASLMEAAPWCTRAADEAALRELARAPGAPASALEYAAWTLTHGHRWNHLTLLANTMDTGAHDAQADGAPPQRPRGLAALNALLVREGFALNPAGGADGFTQGSAAKRLEQSSTVADAGAHTFGCGAVATVPTAFLELIERHEGFGGFLGDNARGIFDSTSTVGRGAA